MPIPRSLRPACWATLAKRLGIPREEIPGRWQDYRSFLDLFTRPLPEGSRPLPEGHAWLSPADGKVEEAGGLTPEGSWWIKGTPYANSELLPGTTGLALGGYQAVQIYLSPRDYHRYHAPCAMEVLEAHTGAGGLQPVDPALVRPSMKVLARNRRIFLHCRSDEGSPFFMLFVGALNVGGMRFLFDPTLGRPPWRDGRRHYDPPPRLEAGEEMGQFELGSTILMVVPPERRLLLAAGNPCRAREPLFSGGPETEH